MTAIEVVGVTKRFGDVTALADLSLTVEKGEIFGFLGPNGAGKSTTINSILDFVRPDEGSITALGHDVQSESRAIRTRTGVLPEGAAVYDRLTGRQHVAFVMDSKGVEADPEQVLARVGLEDAVDRKAGGYSKGMAQRLLLGMALVGEPDLLILDEPSTGLDPNGAREMREIVRAENERGTTVFFSSHSLEQVEAVCDRVGILRNGEMVAVDTVEGLRSSVSSSTTLRVTVDRFTPAAREDLESLADVEHVATEGEQTVVVDCSGSKTAVLSSLEDSGIEVRDFATEQASLEEVFRSYTTPEAHP